MRYLAAVLALAFLLGGCAFGNRSVPQTDTDPIERLTERLRGIGPVDSLRVYRVLVLSDTCDWSPGGSFIIDTFYTVRLEAMYGDGGTHDLGEEIRVLTCGGMIGDLRDLCSSNVYLEKGQSVIIGLTNARDSRYGLIAKDWRLVGYPDGDSIHFSHLGASVDSAGLCRIVESIASGGN